MKHLNYFFAIAAVIATAACTKVEIDDLAVPERKIAFEVASYVPQTKAGHSLITELTGLDVAAGDQVFKSKAFIHADNGSGSTANPVPFFNAGVSGVETISFNDASDEWAPAHTYYWPKAVRSNIDFFSWYDMAGTDPTITFTTPFSSISMQWANRSVSLKDNVMWADGAWHFKNNDGDIHDHDGVTKGVPTLFHHALAQVRFSVKQDPMKQADAKNSGKYTFWEVKLNGVSIAASSVHSNGTLSLSEADPGTASTVQTWTKPENDVWANAASPAYATLDGTTVFNTNLAKGVDGSSNPVYLTGSEQYLTVATNMPYNYFTVRPQAVANGVTLTFTYTIHTWYGTEEQYAAANHAGCTDMGTETVNVNDLGPTVSGATYGAPYTDTGIQLNAITGAWANWQMNKKYTYKLVINPATEQILYDPAVEDWADDANASRTVPQPAA